MIIINAELSLDEIRREHYEYLSMDEEPCEMPCDTIVIDEADIPDIERIYGAPLQELPQVDLFNVLYGCINDDITFVDAIVKGNTITYWYKEDS